MRGQDVHGEGGLEPIGRRPRRVPAHPDSGVVDERVDRAVRVDLVGKPVHLIKLGQIPRD